MNALSGSCLALAIGPTITNMLEFNRLGATQARSPGYWRPLCSSTFNVARLRPQSFGCSVSIREACIGIYDSPMAYIGK